MKKIYWLLLLLSWGCSSVFGQNPIHIKVIDADDEKPISFALIHNRSLDKNFICDEEGNGYIQVFDSTLLKISSVSYQDYYYFIPISKEDTLECRLSKKVYELSEFVVNPYATVALFKRAVADVEISDTNQLDPNLFIAKDIEALALQSKEYQSGDMVSLSFTSPISGLYKAFSKRAKSERKLEQLRNNDHEFEVKSKYYNKAMVRNLTGIKDEKRLAAFMDFCDPSLDFILEATDYELAMLVMNCYESFLLREE